MDLNKGLSESYCNGTLEGLANMVGAFERAYVILGLLGKKPDEGTFVALFLGRL